MFSVDAIIVPIDELFALIYYNQCRTIWRLDRPGSESCGLERVCQRELQVRCRMIRRDISSRLTIISTAFSSYSLKCSLHFSGFPRCPRMKWPPSSIPPGARPLLSTKFRLLFSNDVLASLPHRWLLWPIFPLQTDCSLQVSSWATSFHSSRRRDRMFRIHPTTVRLPIWSLFPRCSRGWFWFVSDLVYTCQSSSVYFSRHTDEGTPPRLLCSESSMI